MNNSTILIASLFNEWYLQGKFNVYKTRHTFVGSSVRDGFAINATLPGVDFWYCFLDMKHWDLFKIKELAKAQTKIQICEDLSILKELY